MKRTKYTTELKEEAVKQFIDRGSTIAAGRFIRTRQISSWPVISPCDKSTEKWHDVVKEFKKSDNKQVANTFNSQTVMCQLKEWFNDYLHSTLKYLLPQMFRKKRSKKLKLPIALNYIGFYKIIKKI